MREGLLCLIISNILGQRWRSSSVPFCFPATEKGWHGYPPQIRSMSPQLSGSKVLTSPQIGTSGQCRLSMCWQKGSYSTNWIVSNLPVLSNPRSIPPMPAKRERTLSFSFMKAPGFFLRILLGEQSSLLLDGPKVVSKKLDKNGFQFEFEDFSLACDDLLS